jgi:hypothetical protein
MKKYMSGGDVKQVKKIAKKEVQGHEKEMHGARGVGLLKMAKGGKTKIRGTGAATKGIYARGPMA